MTYQNNAQGAQTSKNGEITTLVITESMLEEFHPDDLWKLGMNELYKTQRVLEILNKYFQEVMGEMTVEVNLDEVKRQAYDAVLNTSARFSDPLYLARVWFIAVESVLNKGDVTFRLRFPYIEGNE
jgi:hypothetical protein